MTGDVYRSVCKSMNFTPSHLFRLSYRHIILLSHRSPCVTTKNSSRLLVELPESRKFNLDKNHLNFLSRIFDRKCLSLLMHLESLIDSSTVRVQLPTNIRRIEVLTTFLVFNGTWFSRTSIRPQNYYYQRIFFILSTTLNPIIIQKI